MLAALLLLSISAGSVPSANALEQIPREAPSDPDTVVLDCQIVGKALNACQVVGEVSEDQSAAALKLATTLKVPDAVIESGVSHVRLRLKVSPSADGAPGPPPSEKGAKPEQNGINP